MSNLPSASSSPAPSSSESSGHETPIYRAQATLVSFAAGTYLATINVTRSPGTTIANVPTSRAIPAASMVVGAQLAVMFFDHNNSSDAMIVGVF